MVCERFESLDDWFGSTSWFFLSKITKSSESPMSSKHKSFSASELLLLGGFVFFKNWLSAATGALLFEPTFLSEPLKIFPWNVLFGTGGANARQFGGFLSLTFGASNSVWGWLADECRLALFVGDVDVICMMFVFCLSSFFSNKSTKQSVGNARLDALSLDMWITSRFILFDLLQICKEAWEIRD